MLYIYHGPDDFSRAEKINALKQALGDPSLVDYSMVTLEGRGLSLADIRQHADAMPFMTARRLVIITDYLKHTPSKSPELQALLDYLPHMPPTTDVVFSEADSLDKRHPILTAAKNMPAEVVDFGSIDSKNLPRWIEQRVKALQAEIAPPATDLLVQRVGSNLRVLTNELEKLTLYVNQERAISPADVALLVTYVEDAEKFGMANAIGRRDAKHAYDQMHKELNEGKNPIAIMGSIAAQIRALIEVKDLAEQRLTAADIAHKKGWKSDYAAKMRLKEAHNFSMVRLESILETLLEFDLAIKTGKLDSLLALDILIARLCTRG